MDVYTCTRGGSLKSQTEQRTKHMLPTNFTQTRTRIWKFKANTTTFTLWNTGQTQGMDKMPKETPQKALPECSRSLFIFPLIIMALLPSHNMRVSDWIIIRWNTLCNCWEHKLNNTKKGLCRQWWGWGRVWESWTTFVFLDSQPITAARLTLLLSGPPTKTDLSSASHFSSSNLM